MVSQPEKHHYQRGDEVVHPRRPEWGTGVVRQAQPITHQGVRAQRLAVDFANRGRVVINTAVAPLQPARQTQTTAKEQSSTMTRTPSSTSGNLSNEVGSGWLEQLEQSTRNRSHELWELPDNMTDPFASPKKRLLATLESYRFSTDARSLIDWAVGQTGLNDPMSKYTRQELEQAFPRFARDRDQHLAALVRQIKRNGEQHLLSEALQSTRHPAARTALAKAIRH
ncbi:MAG: DUF3553 domain-containing protein [Phycisphaeraceae bacterium]